MPCKDTKSQLSIILDSNDHLLDFEYSKITCNKEIGGVSVFREYCIGKPVDILSKLEFDDLINFFQLDNTESQFLLFLEWRALSVALDQYQGKLIPKEDDKYQIATIAYESDRIEIKQVVLEPPEMPKIIPCRKR